MGMIVYVVIAMFSNTIFRVFHKYISNIKLKLSSFGNLH